MCASADETPRSTRVHKETKTRHSSHCVHECLCRGSGRLVPKTVMVAPPLVVRTSGLPGRTGTVDAVGIRSVMGGRGRRPQSHKTLECLSSDMVVVK